MRSLNPAGVVTDPAFRSSHSTVTDAPACSDVCTTCRLRTRRSGPTATVVLAALLDSAVSFALFSTISLPESVVTASSNWPVAAAPDGQVKV